MKIASANQNLLTIPESSRSRFNNVAEDKREQNAPVAAMPQRSNHGSPYDSAKQFPRQRGPIQQRAIDFYNITAAITNHAGEGELIGVDTYA